MRAAHDDLSAADRLGVKRVHGLPHFQHDKVCDVHDVIDRADAGLGQALLHPARRGCNVHIFDRAHHIPRAQVGRFHAHLHIVRHGFGVFVEGRVRERRRLAQGGRRLAGIAQDG